MPVINHPMRSSPTKWIHDGTFSMSRLILSFFHFGWADMEVPSESFCRSSWDSRTCYPWPKCEWISNPNSHAKDNQVLNRGALSHEVTTSQWHASYDPLACDWLLWPHDRAPKWILHDPLSAGQKKNLPASGSGFICKSSFLPAIDK